MLVYSSAAVSTIGAGTADHLVQRCSRGDHGIDGVFLFDLEVDQHGTIVPARGLDSGHDLGTLGNVGLRMP